MPTFSKEIPGLPGGPLVTDYPIHVRILPASQTNNRPGIKARQPRRSVQHGNGNPNAFGASDSLWLFNGADGAQTSFHADADDMEVWVNIPADEVTWQAADGGGPGNMNGFSCEMSEHRVYRSDMNRLRRNIYVNADFMGRVSARLGIAIPEQHWTFNFASVDRHNCPNILRTMTLDGRPCWDIYAEQWKKSKADELKRMAGDSQYAEPYAIEWKRGDVGLDKLGPTAKVRKLTVELTAVRDTQPRQSASAKAPRTGPEIKSGSKVIAIGTLLVPNGKRVEQWHVLDNHARVPASAFDLKLPKP